MATYHLSKLEDMGLLKKESSGYMVNKFLLEYSVKVSRFLIPRFLFYAIFSFAVLMIELTLMRPAMLTREYIFSVVATSIFFVVFSYETAKTWLRGTL